MPAERRAAFLFDLLQDVNILRPLALLAHQDAGMPVTLLQSRSFANRDVSGSWRAELEGLAALTDARLESFETEFDAWRLLAGGQGVLISASETDQPAHRVNHAVFRLAPQGYLRVTVQHGFECIGFLPNREHIRAHGRNIRFAADVVCGWCEPERMTGVVAAERSKLYVSGPPLLLQPREAQAPTGTGLVCENLHSVRLHASGDFRMSFMDTFFAFCAALEEQGEKVTLRPHPGGQYFQKNGIALPANVDVQNAPAYEVGFGRYAYGISAPSSVLIDMLLAGIPTAVWRDQGEVMDAGNYTGLTSISTLEEWLAFRRAAVDAPGPILEAQAGFLRQSGLLTDAAEVRRRFLELLGGGVAGARIAATTQTAKRELDAPAAPAMGTAVAKRRIMFVANARIPTLQLSFFKPLAALMETGEVAWDFCSEEEVKEKFVRKQRSHEAAAYLADKISAFRPDTVIFCRYSGPHAANMLAAARQVGASVIFHVDDDLLNIPIEIGHAKWQMHNQPTRLATVRTLLEVADLVYASTGPLAQRIREQGFETPIRPGRIYCSGSVLNRAELRPVTRIGYMGFDHAHDFKLAIPALLTFLDRHPDVTFELFGSIPKPEEFERLGERVRVVPPVRDYAQFLEHFASLQWDIGICPLAEMPFNAVKANTKWVEYTSVGAAVIATRGTIYDDCVSGGCGMLAGNDEEWLEALEALKADPGRRHAMVSAAQHKLEAEYSVPRLRDQVLSVLDEAALLAQQRPRADAAPAQREPSLAQ